MQIAPELAWAGNPIVITFAPKLPLSQNEAKMGSDSKNAPFLSHRVLNFGHFLGEGVINYY